MSPSAGARAPQAQYNALYDETLEGVPEDLQDLLRRLQDIEDTAQWLAAGAVRKPTNDERWWKNRRLIEKVGTAKKEGRWVVLEKQTYTQHDLMKFNTEYRRHGLRYCQIRIAGDRTVSRLPNREEVITVLDATGEGCEQYHIITERAHPNLPRTAPFGVYRWNKDQRNHQYASHEHGPATKVWLNGHAQASLYSLINRI